MHGCFWAANPWQRAPGEPVLRIVHLVPVILRWHSDAPFAGLTGLHRHGSQLDMPLSPWFRIGHLVAG